MLNVSRPCNSSELFGPIGYSDANPRKGKTMQGMSQHAIDLNFADAVFWNKERLGQDAELAYANAAKHWPQASQIARNAFEIPLAPYTGQVIQQNRSEEHTS